MRPRILLMMVVVALIFFTTTIVRAEESIEPARESSAVVLKSSRLEVKVKQLQEDLRKLQLKVEEALGVRYNRSLGILLYEDIHQRIGIKGTSFENIKLTIEKNSQKIYAGYRDGEIIAGMSISYR